MGKVLVLLLVGTVAEAELNFVGSTRCATCHPNEWSTWKSGPHSVIRKEAQKERCVLCHQTGKERGIGCEACHGAGSGYTADDIMRNTHLARQLGLVSDALEMCVRCHTPDEQPEFSAKKKWRLIQH